MKTVWLIHNNIPPYRVPLFAEIAKRADFDFRVVLTAANCRHRPHWQADARTLPFSVLTMKGLNIRVSEATSVSISFGLLPSLIRHRPDVVICSGFGLSTLAVCIYAALWRRPYVVWSEGTPITEGLRKIGSMRQWLRRRLARRASAFVDAGTLARDYIRSLLPADSKTPFFRAYNCVDGSLFSAGPMPECSRQASEVAHRVLFVGRLNENKGIPMLLDVYRDLLETETDPVELVLAGEGSLRGSIEEFCRSHESARVKMLGQVPYSDVATYYRSCSVFVLLSLSDCNPLVIFEALHSGIPIVCTNRAGNAPDFIRPGENGYVVDPTDKEGIVRCVREVLAWNPEKRRSAALVSQRLARVAEYPTSAQAFVNACSSVLRPLPTH